MECVNTFYLEQHIRESDRLEQREEAIKDFLYNEMQKEIAESVFEEMAFAGIIDTDVSHNGEKFITACIKKHGYSGIFAEVFPEDELEESLWAEAAIKWSDSLDYY